jgi:hypothetical protein
MPARAVTATSLVLVLVFAAIAVSVVDDREPLDGAVSRSFDTVARAQLERRGERARPQGCRKFSVDLYDCRARVRPTGSRAYETRRFLLTLRDSGCWSTQGPTPVLKEAPSRRLQGCIAQ